MLFLIDIVVTLNHNYLKFGYKGVSMQTAELIQGEKFVDILKKIESLTSSQQRFIQEMLSQRKKVSTLPKKRILKKSFGLWADRGDIKSSTEYVDQLRSEWESRLKRIRG